MHVRKQAVVLAAGLVCLSAIAVAQEAVDLAVVDRIKSEATANSQVMDLLREMTDVHGPRLTGSPGFEDAATWAVERLTGFGIGNVHLERWGPFGRSWSAESASVEVLAPRYARLDATPLAWSAPTAGAITGEPLLAALEFGFFSPKKLADDFEATARSGAASCAAASSCSPRASRWRRATTLCSTAIPTPSWPTSRRRPIPRKRRASHGSTICRGPTGRRTSARCSTRCPKRWSTP